MCSSAHFKANQNNLDSIMLRASVYILLVVCLQNSESARILAWFPAPSISHQVVFRPLTQELAKRGHDITVITPDPAFQKGETPDNFTEIDVHDISYETWRDQFLGSQVDNTDDILGQMESILKTMIKVTDVQLNNTDVKKIITSKTFDLLLLEAPIFPALALTHVFKVPVILISSFGASLDQMHILGAPIHPFLYPISIQKKTYNLTVWEKLQVLNNAWKYANAFEKHANSAHSMLKNHFGEDLPVAKELMKKFDLLLVNEHPVWTGIRPVTPGLVYIGGIHQKPGKELPKELETYLDSSKHGVIYVSFGTNVDPTLLPPEKIQIFIKVFSKLSYDILWKWNGDELPGRTKNIRISKWLPQSDLLYHPKIKLFITQGGLQSTDEAIAAGVPVLGFPMLGDQWYNVERYVHHKIGKQLDFATFDEDSLREAVETLIGDPSYRQNTVKLRDLMRDEPMTPLERAVWWTEHVLRHGGARHLRSPAANMPWTQYYEIELILTVLSVLLVLFITAIMLVGFIWKSLKRSFSIKVKTA